MKTDIPYLVHLEADLERVAAEAGHGWPVVPGGSSGGGGPRRRRPAAGTWLRWSGAAAAVLVLAWGVGSLSGSQQLPLFEAQDGQATMAGTGSASLDEGSVNTRGVEGDSPAPNPLGVDDPAGPPAGGQPDDGTAGDAAIDLAKIDRDGTLTLKLGEGEFDDTFIQVVSIAETNGGMLLASQTTGSDAGVLTLRIPAENFDRTFAAVSGLGAVRESSITGKDVTDEYLDERAHLKIAKGRRDFLFGLYEQATTISSSLQVYNELERVQLRMDQIQGRLNYLDAQTSVSTLKVTLSEREPEPAAQQQDPSVENPSLSRAWERAVQGFLGVLATVIVGLGYLVPIGLLVGIGLLVLTLARRRGPGAS